LEPLGQGPGLVNWDKMKILFRRSTEEACPRKIGFCSMDMAGLLCEKTSSPQSTEGRASSKLAEAPEVMRVVKKRKAQCCLLTALGDKAWPRASSPDEDMPGLVMSPRAVTSATADDVEMRGKACEAAGEAAGKAAAEARPSKQLRMQARSKRKAEMDGVSKGHNTKALQRTLSVYKPFPTPEEAETEVMFVVGDVLTLRSTTVSPVKTRCAPLELSPFDNDRCMKLDFSFGDIDLSDFAMPEKAP
jgi:hypothetical protein